MTMSGQIGDIKGTEGISHLIGLTYDAALEPQKWDIFLKELARMFNSHGAVLRLYDNQSCAPTYSAVCGYDQRFIDGYHDYYHSVDPSTPYLRDMAQEGEIIIRNEALTNKEWTHSEYYTDFASDFGVHKMLGGHFVKRGKNTLRIAVQRSKRCQEFNPQDKALMSLLTPHIQRAYLISRQMQNMRHQKTMVDSILDRFRHAVILLSSSGCVIMMNQQAEKMLRERRGLVVRENKLKALVYNDAQNLQQLIDTVLGVNGNYQQGGAIKLTNLDAFQTQSINGGCFKNCVTVYH